MAQEHLEVERTFAVDYDWPAPDVAELTSLPGVGVVTAAEQVPLEAVYQDTPDLALLRSGVTLRRRTGGPDGGWHLKLPVGSDRLEVRLPLGRDNGTPPEPLLELTAARRRGRPLAPVVRLVNQRVSRRLCGTDGSDLVELADDRVTAVLLDGDGAEREVVRWREVEAELVDPASPAARDVLDALTGLLTAGGASPSPTASKLARALAGRLEAAAPAPGPDSRGCAGDALLAYVAGQVEELTSRDPAVRRDEPDAVHKMRVATRRLRSALRTYRPLLTDDLDPLIDELRWLAGVLGEARDAEVLRERLESSAREVAADVAEAEAVVGALEAVLGARHAAALEDVRAALASDRYLRLLTALDDLVARRPLSEEGARPVPAVLPARVRREWRRLRRRVRDATGDGGRFSLHDVRKAAKRARYAAELAASALPSPAASDADRFATAMESVQEVLGEYQDGVTAVAVLSAVGTGDGVPSDAAFGLGRLSMHEELRADAAASRFADVWRRASRRRLRRWW